MDPGDEVIVPTPCWVSYLEMIKFADGIPVLVPLEENQGFRLDVEKIRKRITAKTKAIIINSPNNPTGAVYNEEDLRQLGQMAIEHDFYIISDEIYELLVYEGVKNVCVASLSPAIKEKTITING
ncbi:MAG: aminotransferase class I/II-fold pyridoxal phosphate-dependent enzyme, partial [Bacteroidales bacterium]